MARAPLPQDMANVFFVTDEITPEAKPPLSSITFAS